MVRLHPDPPPIDRAKAKHRGGAIAQLGERLLCKQEVTGSIPVGSTSSIRRNQQSMSRARDVDWCFFFRKRAVRKHDRLFFNNLGLEGSCSFEREVVMTSRVGRTLGYVLHRVAAEVFVVTHKRKSSCNCAQVVSDFGLRLLCASTAARL